MIRFRHLHFPVIALLLVLTACDAEAPFAVDHAEADPAVLTDSRTPALTLTSVCAGIWRVDNGTSNPITFRWQHTGTRQEGTATAPALGRVFFRAPHVDGTNRVRIYIGQPPVADVVSNNATCGYELVGTVYNDTDGDGQRGAFETGIEGLTVRLMSGGSVIATSRTNHDGAYAFSTPLLLWGATYTIDIPAMTTEADNNESIIPYYFNTSPAALPHAISFAEPPGLENVGDSAPTYGSERLDIGLLLDPDGLRRAFEGGNLERDVRDDQFWWEQMKRALNGDGAQNNTDVPSDELRRLLMLIQNGGEGIDPFYPVPFQFGDNPFAAAERILSESRNRNSQQPDFLSALLTVWLNRVYLTNINTTLLDGLLLAAENAYQQELAMSAAKSASMSTFSTSSTSVFTSTLTSTYRSGSGGIGSN